MLTLASRGQGLPRNEEPGQKTTFLVCRYGCGEVRGGEGQGNNGWGEADQEPETRADMPLDSTLSLRNSEFPFLAPITPKVHIHTYSMS